MQSTYFQEEGTQMVYLWMLVYADSLCGMRRASGSISEIKRILKLDQHIIVTLPFLE